MKLNILSNFFPICTVSQFNIVRNTSNYVHKVYKTQSLKEKDDLCSASLESGKFILFKKQNALFETNSANIIEKLVSAKSPQLLKSNDLYISLKFPNYEELHQFQVTQKIGLDIPNSSVLLEVDENSCAIFAIQLPKMDDKTVETLEEQLKGVFIRPEAAVFVSDPQHSKLFTKGLAMLRWHYNNMFCSKCGGKMQRNAAGTHRHCKKCKKFCYPTPDPVAICIITNEERTKCLLARKPSFPRGLYTAISGFMELGETLNEAIKREVAEEVGLEVKHIEYVDTQFWALGSTSLMVGCIATVIQTSEEKIQLDINELEDAQWFSLEEISAALQASFKNGLLLFGRNHLEDGELAVPPERAIAYYLLRQWVSKR